MGRVCAVLTEGCVLFWEDGQGLCCSDCSGKMGRVCAVLTAVERWAGFVLF